MDSPDLQYDDEVRERVIRVSAALFARRGVLGVTCDEVLLITGVGAREFSRLFPSRDELVLAYLAWWDRAWMLELMSIETTDAVSPLEGRLLAVFDALSERLRAENFDVLPFTRVLIEVGSDHPIGRACIRYLEGVRAIMASIAAQAGLVEPESFAASWHILLEGSFIAGAEGDVGAAHRAKALAKTLITRHRPSGSGSLRSKPSARPLRDRGDSPEDWISWL